VALDRDRDGRLSVDELAPSAEDLGRLRATANEAIEAQFAGLDQDADGRVSPGELTTAEATALVGAASSPSILGAPPLTRDAFRARALDAAAREVARVRDQAAGDDVRSEAWTPRASGRRPIVLVPGYLEPWWLFWYIRGRLERDRLVPAETVSMFPALRDIRVSARVLKTRVDTLRRQYGGTKLDVIGHSEGGLIARYMIKSLQGTMDIERYVSLASPHHGTLMAYLGPGESARQMQPGSGFLHELNAGDPTPGAVRYTSIYTNTDLIVVPSSSSYLPGATNHEIRWLNHLFILMSGKTYDRIVASLR
jgi:triacylglycerol esterase/lipase EstA (alpha/beta hydrolase family)